VLTDGSMHHLEQYYLYKKANSNNKEGDTKK